MSYGPLSVFTLTMASGGTTTSSIDLARSWKNTFLEIPTMTSNTELYVYGANQDSNFRRIFHPQANTQLTTSNQFIISSSTTNALVLIPNGIRYLKILTSATVDNGCIYKIICSD